MARKDEGAKFSPWERAMERDPRLKEFARSGVLESVVMMLEPRRRLKPFKERLLPLDEWLRARVQGALSEPPIADRMTGGERRKISKTIVDSANKLGKALSVFKADYGFMHPFQGEFDFLAMQMAMSEEERFAKAGFPMDAETSNACRFAVYNFLMDHMDDLLAGVVSAAEHYAEIETIIKQPNDANASRLYFLRKMNRAFCVEFRSPCRAANLALASAFFDCDDLDEAAVSKLAPFYKPVPIELPDDQVEGMQKAWESLGEPGLLKELLRHLEDESKWGMGRKYSAEEK